MQIKQSGLPLSPNELASVHAYCLRLIDEGRLIIGNGIPYILRQDYLDQALPFPDRAIKNITVNPDVWRKRLKMVWDTLVDKIVDIHKHGVVCNREDILTVYAWRAALSATHSFIDRGFIKHCHFGISRNEEQPHTTGLRWMEIDPKIFKGLGKNHQVIIPDTMNATGGSIETIIITLLNNGVQEDRIIPVHIISAPEGIFNLTQEFPKIKIITATLDSHLNDVAYIQPGLGDAGDKFFDKITLAFFKPICNIFNNSEWEELKNQIKLARARRARKEEY